MSESLQDVAGGKHTPVTSTGALYTSVCLAGCIGTGCASCVCVWNTALCASVRAQTASMLTEILKVAAFCIVNASKLFCVAIERSCFSLFAYWRLNNCFLPIAVFSFRHICCRIHREVNS